MIFLVFAVYYTNSYNYVAYLALGAMVRGNALIALTSYSTQNRMERF